MAVILCLLIVLVATKVDSKCQLVKSLITGSIPDTAFTASSSLNANHGPERARTATEKSWCSQSLGNITASPWIQVDLGDNYEIHSIAVAGHDRAGFMDDFIVNYYVLYGSVNNSLKFVSDSTTGQAKVFPRHRNRLLQTIFFPEPINGQIIRIMALPGSWSRNRVCIQFEVNGCSTNLTTSTVSSQTYKQSTITISRTRSILGATTVFIQRPMTSTLLKPIEKSIRSSITVAASISVIVTMFMTLLGTMIVVGISLLVWIIFKKRRNMSKVTQTTPHQNINHYYEDVGTGTISLRRNREIIRYPQYDKLERQESVPERVRSGSIPRSLSESALYDNLDTLQYDYVSTERIVVSRTNSKAALKTSVESVNVKNDQKIIISQVGSPAKSGEEEELFYNPSYGQTT